MRSASIVFHRVVGGITSDLPFDDLRTLFNLVGISLNCSIAPEPLLTDPRNTSGYQQAMNSICPISKSSPMVGEPAHLIVGVDWLEGLSPTQINGMLLDTSRRGFAAVFTNSADLRSHDSGALLETLSHEIGHMFNLTHADANGTIPTAMCPAFIRDQFFADYESAWERDHEPRRDNVPAYPFGTIVRDTLNARLDAEVLPWGVPFFGAVEVDAEDSISPGQRHLKRRALGAIALDLHRTSFTIGSALTFDLILKNPNRREIRVPSRLDPMAKNLTLAITRPDGRSYIHKPKMTGCPAALVPLKAGQAIVSPQFISHGPQGIMFPTCGRYLVQASSPWALSPSKVIEIQVKRSVHEELNDPSFAWFLAGGALPTYRKQYSRLEGILRLASKSRSPDLPHLALLRSRHVRYSRQVHALLKIARRSGGAKAVQHAAVIDQAIHMRRAPHALAELHRIASDQIDCREHPAFFDLLRQTSYSLNSHKLVGQRTVELA